jgi:hypothetical protein
MPSLVDYGTPWNGDAITRGLEAGAKARHNREQVAVDEATRQGVGEMLDRGGSAGYVAPSMAPQGINLASVPPTPPAVAQRDAALDPEPMSASAAPAPAATTAPTDEDTVVRTIYGEAGNQLPVGQRAVAHVIRNRSLQSGLTPGQVALAPGQFEPWSNEAAKARMLALDPASPEYQQILAHWRAANGGAPDPTGGATHFYSPTAQAALGRPTPSWAQGAGQDIGEHRFYNLGYRAPAGGVPQSTPSMAPFSGETQAGGMAPGTGNFNARYDPILRRLSAVPGGGEAALKIMAGQSRYDQAQGKRGDNYNRLAMQAFARGDVESGQYFAKQGGLNLPSWVGQDMAATRRVGVAGLLAHRLYGDADLEGAQRFVTAYMKSGDAGQALSQAGPPAGRVVSVRQVYDAENDVYRLIGVQRNGMATPVAGTDGQQVTSARPPNTQVIQTGEGPATVDKNNPSAPANPIMAPNGTRATSPATGAIQQKYEMLKTVPGIDDAEARLIAAGQEPAGGVKPETIINYRRSRANALSVEGKGTSADQAQRLDAEMNALFPGWQTMTSSPGQRPPGGTSSMAPREQAPQTSGRPNWSGAGMPPAQTDTAGAAAIPAHLATQLKPGVGRVITKPDGSTEVWTLDANGMPKKVR